jgi:4'-phosphopantetheinyl transferase
MDQTILHLWCAHPDDLLDEDAAQACAGLLSEEEHTRWRAFRFELHRREYLATHALVRTALSHYGQLTPAAWRFTKNDHGKPAIEPDCGLRFNLSNSTGLVVCLISASAEVGVDVEPHARAASIAEVARRMFSPQELAQLDALGEAGRLQRCVHLWTLKEAYIKARGMGLSLPTNKFSLLFDGDVCSRLEIDASLGDDAGRWRFCLIDHAEHCIALMVEGGSAIQLTLQEARPACAAPRALALADATWLPRR